MLRLQPASLVIPERVAVAVEANGLLIVRQRVDLLHEKGVRHGLLAGGALLPVAWTRKHSRGAVTRQATGQEPTMLFPGAGGYWWRFVHRDTLAAAFKRLSTLPAPS